MEQGRTAQSHPRSTARVVDAILLLAGLASVAFYAFLLQRFNAAPELRGQWTLGDPADFRLAVDRCTASTSKVTVSGWIARPGVHRTRHATTAVLRDDSDGRLYVMRTDIVERRDVTEALNVQLGDRVDYANNGFAASLNVGRSGRSIRSGRVFLAYDDGRRYTLVPTHCTWSATP